MTSHIRVEAKVLTMTFKTVMKWASSTTTPTWTLCSAIAHSFCFIDFPRTWMLQHLGLTVTSEYTSLRIHGLTSPQMSSPQRSRLWPTYRNFSGQPIWTSTAPPTLCVTFTMAYFSSEHLHHFLTYCIFSFVRNPFSLLIYELHENREWICSLLYPQCLEQCLAHNKYALMIPWTNESMSKYPFA